MKKVIVGNIVDTLLIAGWALSSVGVYLYSRPAGLIVAGVLLIAGGIWLGRGSDT